MSRKKASAEAANPRRSVGRFSARRKLEAVLRLVGGEGLDAVSRDIGVTAGTLASWRDKVLAGGEAALKNRPGDERDEDIKRLHAKIGEITMENELLRERARAAEGSRSLRHGRSSN
jgi:transposase